MLIFKNLVGQQLFTITIFYVQLIYDFYESNFFHADRPGGLKNAIDWASRGQDSPLLRMQIVVMDATQGMWETIRM